MGMTVIMQRQEKQASLTVQINPIAQRATLEHQAGGEQQNFVSRVEAEMNDVSFN